MTENANNTHTPEQSDSKQTEKQTSLWVKIWPVYIFIVVIAIAIWLVRANDIGLTTLQDNYQFLISFIEQNWIVSILLFLTAYIVTTVFVLPIASLLTISGGALFGLFIGSIGTLSGAVLGASILFWATNSFLGRHLRERAAPFLKRMEEGFNESPFTYMFAMRLVPAIPFYIANTAPAMLGAKFRDYFITTATGIIPGTVAYTWIGVAIKNTLATNGDIDIGALAANFTPAFIALAVVALIPVAYRGLRAMRAN